MYKAKAYSAASAAAIGNRRGIVFVRGVEGERLVKSDVKYRFSIDMASLKAE